MSTTECYLTLLLAGVFFCLPAHEDDYCHILSYSLTVHSYTMLNIALLTWMFRINI